MERKSSHMGILEFVAVLRSRPTICLIAQRRMPQQEIRCAFNIFKVERETEPRAPLGRLAAQFGNLGLFSNRGINKSNTLYYP